MITLRPIDEFRTLEAGAFLDLCKKSAKLQDTAKDATTAHTGSFPAVGKLLCVASERLDEGKKTNAFPRTWTVSQYWQSLTGAKVNNHAYSCSVTFDTYVRTGLVPEQVYDGNTGTSLELAASIATAVQCEITNDAVVQAADLLQQPLKDAAKAKALRELLDTVKPRKPLEADKAAEMLKSIFAAGHLTLVLNLATAEIAYLKDDEKLKAAWTYLNLGLDHIPAELQDTWCKEREDASRGVQVTRGETPAPAAPAPTPEPAPAEAAADTAAA